MAKLFITLATLCIFGAVVVKGFDKKQAMASLMTKVDECKTEVGAKDSDIAELMEKKSPASKEGKCLLLCLMQKYEVMNGDGEFIKDAAIKHAEKYVDGDEARMAVATEIIDTCTAIEVESDPCEAAAQYCMCFDEQAEAHGVKDHFEF
ncbi:hypothetical protein DOY81_003212 [Sarcophaga bullata]|nr:hypothetical protein DOY81_003212 [Sarcophaga bullata]